MTTPMSCRLKVEGCKFSMPERAEFFNLQLATFNLQPVRP